MPRRMHQIFNAHHRPGDFDIQESTTVAQFNKMRAFKFQKIIFFLYNGGISNRPGLECLSQSVSVNAPFFPIRENSRYNTRSRGLFLFSIAVNFHFMRQRIEHP
ncbi:hypothetical protein ACV1F1_07965, partial [Klebsiella pneumoniae]